MIDSLVFSRSEEHLAARLHTDVPLLILGSVIAAIGLSALLVHVLRQRSHDRVLLWFGLFAGPYGLRLLTSSFVFRLAFGEPHRLWLFVGRFVDFVVLVPALFLFDDFYGRGWKSLVRRFIWAYVIFAAIAFGTIVVRKNPDLVPTAGIGIVLGLPVILLLGRIAAYEHPRIESPGVLLSGLVIFLVTFAYDRLASIASFHADIKTEPYGLFLLICCLGYAATRRVLANERQLASLSEEMRAATQIQTAILPRSVPDLETLDIAVRYAPMAAVAGDFYDFLLNRPGCVGIVVADVAGHGVPAALVASMVKVAISSQTSDCAEPESVIRNLNSTLCREARGQYATAVCVYLDEKNRIGYYSAAGHPPLLLWERATRSLRRLGESGLLLGVRPTEDCAQAEFSLRAGDRLIIYTDGLTEATNARGEEYGEARLADFVGAHENVPAARMAERLLQDVTAWPGKDQRQQQADDITFVVIDIGRGKVQSAA